MGAGAKAASNAQPATSGQSNGTIFKCKEGAWAPGHSLSLQLRHEISEGWVVVSDTSLGMNNPFLAQLQFPRSTSQTDSHIRGQKTEDHIFHLCKFACCICREERAMPAMAKNPHQPTNQPKTPKTHWAKCPLLLFYFIEYHGIFSSIAGELYKMNLQSWEKNGWFFIH